MEISVVELTQHADFTACAAFMSQSNPWDALYFSQEQCEADLARPELVVHGAMTPDGTIAGFLAAMANGIGLEPMIEYLCVRSDFRNQGIGKKLIGHFEDVLFPDADNLYLFVSDINPNAIRLYVRLHYLPVGALPNFNLEAQTEFLHRKTRRPRQLARKLEHESRLR
jgi:ribosomal protein S18 acetylase RimI-like enzyme